MDISKKLFMYAEFFCEFLLKSILMSIGGMDQTLPFLLNYICLFIHTTVMHVLKIYFSYGTYDNRLHSFSALVED